LYSKKKTDLTLYRRQTFRVIMARVVYNDFKKPLTGVRKIYERNIQILCRHLPALMRLARRMMKLPPVINIRFARVRGKGRGRNRMITKGIWYENCHTVTINAYAFRDVREMIRTLGHELRHACQYRLGQIGIPSYYRLDGGEAPEIIWMGEGMNLAASNHDEYLNQPWEIEARKTGDEFYELVMADKQSFPDWS
jgi:hypothetical protein